MIRIRDPIKASPIEGRNSNTIVSGLRCRCGNGYLAVFTISPLIIGISVGFQIMAAAGCHPPKLCKNPVITPIAFFYLYLLEGPLQDEFGWHGTSLDPLQDRYSALWANLWSALYDRA